MIPYHTRHYHICPMCQQEARDKHKTANRELVKARGMVYGATKKFNRENNSKLTNQEFMRMNWKVIVNTKWI